MSAIDGSWEIFMLISNYLLLVNTELHVNWLSFHSDLSDRLILLCKQFQRRSSIWFPFTLIYTWRCEQTIRNDTKMLVADKTSTICVIYHFFPSLVFCFGSCHLREMWKLSFDFMNHTHTMIVLYCRDWIDMWWRHSCVLDR
jgi:hypothetical protein